jgi:hypothetical protein
MTEFRITFGSAHERPPLAHPDGWLAVEAPDEMAARRAVIAVLDRRWSFIYAPGDGGYPTLDSGSLGFRYYPRGELGRLDAATGEIETGKR